MKKQGTAKGAPGKSSKKREKKDIEEGLVYPPTDDIYIQQEKLDALDPDDLTTRKSPNMKADGLNEKDFEEDVSGDDLDIPGSELDDAAEAVGSEDEENNYYSLGGDRHNDLEEPESEVEN